MSDKYKGFLVVFEDDIIKDKSEDIIITLKTIKGVLFVVPYLKDSEDYITENKIRRVMRDEILEYISERYSKDRIPLLTC